MWNALTAAAKAARAAGDRRSLDQLRADILIARATTSPLAPPLPGDTWDIPPTTKTARRRQLGDIHASGDPDDIARHADDPQTRAARPAPTPDRQTDNRATDAGPAQSLRWACCHACGQSAGAGPRRRPGLR